MTVKFSDFLAEQLKDPEFRAEYEALEAEEAIMKAMMSAQIQRHELSKIADFIFRVVSAYEQIYEGSNGSILLSKALDEQIAVVA